MLRAHLSEESWALIRHMAIDEKKTTGQLVTELLLEALAARGAELPS